MGEEIDEKPSVEVPEVGPSQANAGADLKKKKARRQSISAQLAKKQDTPVQEWKIRLLEIVDGPYVSTFMTIVTIWALFGDDIRLIACDYEDDDGFVGVTIFCLICFTLEAVLFSILQPDYFLGFYFWMDAVATVSLLFDIPEVLSGIKEGFGVDEAAPSDEDLTLDSDSVAGGGGSQVGDATTLTRASRTSRAGSKAGRIVRLVRLVRILKLYKQISMQANKEEEQEVEVQEEETKESQVGKKLSDLTTRRVIIGVLLMLFCLQLFNAETWVDKTTIGDGGLKLVVSTFQAQGESKPFFECMDAYVRAADSSKSALYWIKIQGIDYSDRYEIEGIRHRKLRTDEYETFQDQNSFAKFDIREQSEMQAILNILKTIFVCFVLGVGAMCFSSDANKLVLAPIERMFARVRELSKNPLSKDTRPTVKHGKTKDGQEYETKILEDAFKKVCELMAVGFGEAGAEIIAENMVKGGKLEPMIPGKKMVAIFGFCDIRQFTDATEILQEGVMEFVNSIAQIVHMEVALHKGSANKNIGDAFLLVWKFPKEVGHEDIAAGCRGGLYKGPEQAEVNSIADKALASFIVMCAMLKKSAKVRAYSDNPELCAKMPNYRVKMGFGLHVGWAIEGAIGSEYKVDASYLSPNVNMAARLEAATKQFGVPFLLSEDFMSIVSRPVYNRCRQIDRVTVKGSTQPMGLFTYDVELDDYQADLTNPLHTNPDEKPINFTSSRNVDEDYEDEFSQHPDILAISAATPEFLAKFGEGFLSYKQGDWKTAKKILTKLENARKSSTGRPIKDGPSRTLLDVMAEYDFKSPADWPGFRELTEK